MKHCAALLMVPPRRVMMARVAGSNDSRKGKATMSLPIGVLASMGKLFKPDVEKLKIVLANGSSPTPQAEF